MRTVNKTIIAFGLAVYALAGACKKQPVQEIECGYSSAPSPYLFLSVTDSIGRDLFQPTTPGFYQIGDIVNQNKDVINYSGHPRGANDPYRLMIPAGEQEEKTSYIKFSDTDQDTIYIKYEIVPQKCLPKYLLKSFKYNGKELADSAMHRFFTIKK